MADCERMIAMQIDAPGARLRLVERAVPKPAAGEVLLKVEACGVCRTDLHVLDGEVSARFPIIPGHEIVGRIAERGSGARGFAPGQRVGVPWLGYTCGTCPYCRMGRENLCDRPEFTGATRDGGYAAQRCQQRQLARQHHRFRLLPRQPPCPVDLGKRCDLAAAGRPLEFEGVAVDI